MFDDSCTASSTTTTTTATASGQASSAPLTRTPVLHRRNLHLNTSGAANKSNTKSSKSSTPDTMPDNLKLLSHVEENNGNSGESVNNLQYLPNEIILEYQKLHKLQESIKELNDTIFKDPRNKQRPPSEYLGIFNRLTAKLHLTQQNLEKLELELNLNIKQTCIVSPSSSSLSTIVSSTSDYESLNSTLTLTPTDTPNDNNFYGYSYNNNNSNGNISAAATAATTPTHDDTNELHVSSQLLMQSPNLLKRGDRGYSSSTSQNSISTIASNTSLNIPRLHVELSTSTVSSTISTDLLRIWYSSSSIGNGTVVIKKQENSTLREALSNKFKARNLDIDKCIAYAKDSNAIIQWNSYVLHILHSDIFVTEKSSDIYHNFEKHTVSFRLCFGCNKRNLLNAYTCKRCEYTKCSRTDCRDKSDDYVCVPKNKNINSKPDSDGYKSSGSESPYRKIIDFSAQILPIPQLSAIPPRDRSRSENELDNLIDTQSQPNTPRPVPKSITNISNAYNSDKTKASYDYSTMPRQHKSATHSRPPLPTSESRSSNVSKPNRRDSLNSWEIPITQIIDHGRKVGSGSFGTVHESIDFYHGKVAIKYLNVQNPTPVQTEAFRNEVAILKTTRHDNILLFIGCISTPFLAIVTEWCKGSSLYRHLHVEEVTWNMYQLVDIAKQIGTGMEYLHARDILHRDLKSNNIFLIPDENYAHSLRHQHHHHHHHNQRAIGHNSHAVSSLGQRNGTNHQNPSNSNECSNGCCSVEKWIVKIGDFGLATVKSASVSAKQNNPTGSILWMAPEVITQKLAEPYTQKSDVYAYGVVLYELVTGQLPYAQKEQDMILFLVGIGRLKPNPEDSRKDTPVAVKNLIQKCCEYDRNKRPVFVEMNAILNDLQVTRLKRAQSAPNMRTNYDSSTLIGLSITDDDIYPSTPLPLDYNIAATHFTTNL